MAAAVLIAVAIRAHYFSPDPARPEQPLGRDAVTSRPGERVVSMAPMWVSGVGAQVAERAPVILANGGPDPIHLGAWRKQAEEPCDVSHIWNWSESPKSRALRDVKAAGILSPDGRLVLSTDGEILDLETSERSKISLGGDRVLAGPGTYRGICSMRFSPDGSRVALRFRKVVKEIKYGGGRIEGEWVQILEFPSAAPLCRFPIADGTQLRLCFSPDGRQITTCDFHRRVMRRDTTTGEVLREYAPMCDRQVIAVQMSADGRFIAAVEMDGHVLVWNTESGELLHRLDRAQLGLVGDLVMARFSPDGQYLAVANWSRHSIVDTTTGERVASLSQSAGLDTRWSDDSSTITVVTRVAGAERPSGRDFPQTDRYDVYPSVHIWDWRRGKRIESLTSDPPE